MLESFEAHFTATRKTHKSELDYKLWKESPVPAPITTHLLVDMFMQHDVKGFHR